VVGGGRYDKLVTELGGPDTPAVGWAMGLERMILLLKQAPQTKAAVDFYLVSRGDKAEQQAVIVAQSLRQQGFSVEMDLSGSAFGKQFKRADRSGAAACLILGDTEAEAKTVQLKWMASGEQHVMAQADLPNQVASLREQISAAPR